MSTARTRLDPVILEGRYVRLEPLTIDHVLAFHEAANEWQLSVESVRTSIEAALHEQAAGTSLPFATVDRGSGHVVGGTRFLRFVPEHHRVEIGSSWLARPWRRTAVNTEAKLLMLGHAFDHLGCTRVEFLVDLGNHVSRTAVRRLGAKEEGVLRGYRLNPEGEQQDVVSYSILASEWPLVRSHLRQLLSR